jgi:hypothetical protein
MLLEKGLQEQICSFSSSAFQHVGALQEALSRHQICQHLDLGVPASSTEINFCSL